MGEKTNALTRPPQTIVSQFSNFPQIVYSVNYTICKLTNISQFWIFPICVNYTTHPVCLDNHIIVWRAMNGTISVNGCKQQCMYEQNIPKLCALFWSLHLPSFCRQVPISVEAPSKEFTWCFELIHNLCKIQKIQIRGMKKKQESKSRAKRKVTQMLTLKSLTPSPQRVAPPQRVDFWIRKHPPPKELRPPKELIFGSGNTHPQRVATGDTIKKMRLGFQLRHKLHWDFSYATNFIRISVTPQMSLGFQLRHKLY